MKKKRNDYGNDMIQCKMVISMVDCGKGVDDAQERFRSQVRYDDEDEDEGPQPDPMLEQGAPIPVRLHNEFPPELSSTPLEDIDSFYHNQRVSIFYYETGENSDFTLSRVQFPFETNYKTNFHNV